MGSQTLLHVGHRIIKSSELSYEDLVALYKQFIKDNDRVPTTSECTSINNLPSPKVLFKILKDNNMLYGDFLTQFGKYSHVRTDDRSLFDFYVERFKKISIQNGSALKISDFLNNKFGLPSPKWLIENCPDKSVTTYLDFVKWCKLDPVKHVWTKEEVENKLRSIEKELGRPIVMDDVTADKCGFSMIVVNRLYGNLSSAKEQIGLLKTLSRQPTSFEQYKKDLTEIILDYMAKTGKDYISWRDIESGTYGFRRHEHKSYTKAFKRANVDIFIYIKSLGCAMNPSGCSFTYLFDDGEKTDSGLEHDLSLYLRSLGFVYGTDYTRFVKYKDFTKDKSKMDCDYLLDIDGKKIYIEVLGFIHRSKDDWRTHNYSSERENKYRDKMIKKERLMLDAGVNYLFLFYNDFVSDKYKKLVDATIKDVSCRKAA